MGADSRADIGTAARALASAMPSIVTAAQPGACLASLNISSMLSSPFPELEDILLMTKLTLLYLTANCAHVWGMSCMSYRQGCMLPAGLQRQVMTLSGCISYEQCSDGSEPTTWQCAYNSTGVPVEIEASALLDALPSAKAGVCKQVLPSRGAVCPISTYTMARGAQVTLYFRSQASAVEMH